MTKADIVKEVAKGTGVDKAVVLVCVDAWTEEIKKALENNKNIYMRGFGSFIVKKRAAKTARNILKNVAVHVPACAVPSFKPAKEFSDRIKSNVKVD